MTDDVDDEFRERIDWAIEEERDILDRLADDPPATDDAQPEHQDDAIEIGRNPDHPRLAIQSSPWDTDKLLLWSIHDGEKWTKGTYLRADEVRRLADTLTTLAAELDDSDGDADDAPDDSFPPGRPDYYDKNPGWADDLPDLGENDAETLDRECVVCGESLTIHVANDGTYEGGHYWPNLLEDEDREYWECEECHATN